MGRKPMEKPKHDKKKGLWSPEEDEKLRSYIFDHGHAGFWSSIATNAGLQRSGKSCRLRWINYLRPGLKRGAFTLEEEEIILTLHQALGNKWSQMAHYLPGRTDNEIKNYWHSHLKKRVASRISESEDVQQTEADHHVQGSQRHKMEEFIMSQLQIEKSKCISISSSSSSMPRVLFADWLSLDVVEQQTTRSTTADSGGTDLASCRINYSYSEDCLLQIGDDHQLGHMQLLHQLDLEEDHVWEQLAGLMDYFAV